MTKTSETPEVVVEQKSDYSVINKYADATLDKHRNMLANNAVVRLRRIIIAIAILSLALGIALFLYFFGLSILEKARRTEVKEVPEVLSEISETVPISEGDAQGNNVKTEYTVFFTYNGIDYRIVTGWNFTPENTDKPYHQYCYHAKASHGLSELTTPIANKTDALPTIWENNVTDELRYLAKKHCKFD